MEVSCLSRVQRYQSFEQPADTCIEANCSCVAAAHGSFATDALQKCLKYLQQETFFSHQRNIRDALQMLMVAVTNIPQDTGELLDDERIKRAFTGQQLNM